MTAARLGEDTAKMAAFSEEKARDFLRKAVGEDAVVPNVEEATQEMRHFINSRVE
jgi:hypothetical protein